ncbi:RDD family protein [Streptomyces sp. TRM49041]|uniref:RDD family protein n=1 Tax=Streptomyces sp. TRM49041 TaxID=2603216 RepID=UPI0011EE4B5C|nr:RDD family protein [Streptomyces sp. TRM49041]
MSNEPPKSGQPPEDDPFRKRPQQPSEPPEGDSAPPPPPPPGGGGYEGGPPGGGGPYDGGPYGGGPPGGGPPGDGPYGGGPYGYGGTDPLAGMPPLGDTGKRVLARLVDWLIIFIPLAALGIPFGIYTRVTDDGNDLGDVWTGDNTGGQWAFQLISIVAYVAYDTLMTSKRNGQTVGKRLMGLRVAMLNDGSVPTTNPALIRALVLWLPALICCACLWPLLLLIMILVDKPYKQGFHDKAAKTVVVSTT